MRDLYAGFTLDSALPLDMMSIDITLHLGKACYLCLEPSQWAQKHLVLVQGTEFFEDGGLSDQYNSQSPRSRNADLPFLSFFNEPKL